MIFRGVIKFRESLGASYFFIKMVRGIVNHQGIRDFLMFGNRFFSGRDKNFCLNACGVISCDFMNKKAAAPSKNFFRVEAVKRHSSQWIGSTCVAVPISFKWYSIPALALALSGSLYLGLGKYTTYETTTGIIQPNSGIEKIYAKNGVLVKSVYVREGQAVHEGAALFSVEPAAMRERGASSYFRRNKELEENVPARTSGELTVNEGNTSKSVRSEVFGNGVINSPVAGIVVAVNKKNNADNFSFAEPVILIAPTADPLVVNGYVSAVAVARLHDDAEVQVQVQAFKGHPQGRLPGRITRVGRIPTDQGGQDLSALTGPRYPIAVEIDLATALLPKEKLLGMQAEVKIPLETRRLYQWILDPLQNVWK